MIFIVVKYDVKPESVDEFPEAVRTFTEAVRQEPGNLWFEWSKSLEKDNEFVLIEAFTDEGAEPHVKSDHFAAGLEAMRPHLASTPKIISRKIDGEGWDEMGELQIG
ncbi:putative quinol monooxygenase [Brevibacterium sp. UCMA 11752]|uniref:putative quinol monooxygenase n=1 Tax=Brevibacterium sp. UCMA 11752 TaxID=2745946 RepID=UPI001F3CCCB5|nr:putative quinol monooxygenase [Brevibacterium sp. UCMA 11752]MCF2589007.1 antibiotic biosynthesis monooxygenase [Brevibacterium sp. UCMA 11752]